jgi:multidrug resistance protein MdtO
VKRSPRRENRHEAPFHLRGKAHEQHTTAWFIPAASQPETRRIRPCNSRRWHRINYLCLDVCSREPISDDLRNASERSYSLRETINSNFDRVRDFTGGVLLEFGPFREPELAWRQRIIRWQAQVRIFFLTEIVLWKYRAQLPGFELPRALVTQQRQFDEGFASTLEGMADRLEGRSSKSPSFEDSMAHHERNAEAYAKAPEQTFSDRNSQLLSLRRRIQNLTTSLTQEI